MSAEPTRARFFAVLFGLLALATFLQPIAFPPDSGLVFLGKRLSGAPNLIASWCFAAFLACYAAALWQARPVALPLGIGYAAYLAVSLHYGLLFSYRSQGNASPLSPYAIALLLLAWAAVAVMVHQSWGTYSVSRALLRACALLFAVMALSNGLKPFAYAPDIGLVLFGQRLSGTVNSVASLIFAVLLAVYAVSIWTEKRLALVLGTAYALYVPANIMLWNPPDKHSMPGIMALPYLVAAIGVSSGAAILLWRRRRMLT